jgi:carbon storage regulator CsrA
MVGEQILIGDDVVITLLSNEGPASQIHVSAPRGVSVDRAETRRRKNITGIDRNRRP